MRPFEMAPAPDAQNGANGFDNSKAYQAQEEEGTAFVGYGSRTALHIG